MSLDEAERAKPVLAGTVNGFRFFGPDDPPKQYPCDPNSTEIVFSEESLPFQVAYLPVGSEGKTSRIQSCSTSEIQLAVREFSLGGTAFSVAYHGGELAIYNDGLREGRVQPIDVQGEPGAAAYPLADDGYGESLIVWPTEHGFLRVYATDMPFDEVRKIADGVTCTGC